MIPGDEELCLFLRKGKDKYREQLFRPRPKESPNATLSTCRTAIGAEALRRSGEIYAANTDHELGSYALFLTQAARDLNLSAEETPGLYPGHVDVGSWPDDADEKRKIVGNALFAAARPSSPECYPESLPS